VSALALVVMAVGLRSLIPLLDATATLSLGPSGDYGRIRTVGSVSFVLMALFLQYVPVLKPDRSLPIIIWIAVTSVATLASCAILPDRDPAELKSRRSAAAGGEHSRKWDRAFIVGLVMIGLGRVAMAPVSSFFSIYVVEELHWDAVGLLWALSACSEIPVMFLSARLIRRFGSPPLLALSVVAVAARLAIYALFPNPAGVVAGQLLHSLCYGLFHPAAIAFVATSVPPERRALGMAMYLSLGQGLPTFIGSALGGFIVEGAGYRTLFGSYIGFAALSLAVYFATRKLLERPVRA
jgi:PPP family 3-phenylpropionic acid transporter